MYDDRLNDKTNSQPANVAASAVKLMVIWLKEKWLSNRGWIEDKNGMLSKPLHYCCMELDEAIQAEDPNINNI